MTLYKIVRSKGYKNFMAKLYGIGASIVILGALFKILHMQGADLMLMLGMGTEALIFFFSAFEPLHKEYDWALVYPELQDAMGGSKNPKGTVSQQLDRMLEEAKIGPELIDSLAAGMRNLGDNVKKLSTTTDAALATEGYIANISKAKDAVQNLTNVYEKSAHALSDSSELQIKSVQEMFEAQKHHAQKMQDVQNQSIQKIGQIQEQGNQAIVESYKKIEKIQELGNQTISENYKKIGQIHEQGSQVISEHYRKMQDTTAMLVNNLNDTATEAQKYKQEVDKLSKNVAQMNAIYANMLAAMTNK
ncbi:MAG: gliding motility protein GldL [Lentimicrobiaceae bacterium]|nr:gliding motility protein GldL [Lentimicrobiaceae bacterium]